MEAVADFYLDNAGLLFLAAFLAVTIVLMAMARLHLSSAWWIGALVSGLAVAGVATMIALALQGLDTGDPDGIEARGWLAIAIAGFLGAIAGADVQLAIGAVRGERGGAWTVVAGAVFGPLVIIGGYLLLVRSMEWIRFGVG